MGIIAKDSGGGGGDFEPVPAGTHLARCLKVIDLGLQQTGSYGLKHKVFIQFEVPGVRVQWRDSDGYEKEGPALIGTRYTLSLNKKSILSQHLESWRGKPFTDDERKGFDIAKLVGVPAMLSVVHNQKGDRTYDNINAIMRPMQGVDVPPLEGEPFAFSYADQALAGNYDKLTDYFKKLVDEGQTQLSPAEKNVPQEPPPPATAAADAYDDFDDDIPF